jgi:mono/diheme cytochrome c family protein
MIIRWPRPLIAALGLTLVLVGEAAAATPEDATSRGAYLVHAGGCISCHTVPGGASFAGGRALATPFGIFYSPNITPDPQTGIGRWSNADFLRALREGVRPDGANYFPVFPYPSFTKITDEDALAIKAYLFSLPPVQRPNRRHDVSFPFSWRFLQNAWKLLFFEPGPLRPDPRQTEAYNRGAYLVTALAHCGECHTPRNFLGGLDRDRGLSGTPDGPDNRPVPNITPDPATGIGEWDKSDLAELLKTGSAPDGSEVKGAMREAIEDGLKYLSPADLDAIAEYVLSQKPVVHEVSSKR